MYSFARGQGKLESTLHCAVINNENLLKIENSKHEEKNNFFSIHGLLSLSL